MTKRKNDCCNDEKNLDKKVDGNKEIETCRVCGCNHYKFKVAPLNIKIS